MSPRASLACGLAGLFAVAACGSDGAGSPADAGPSDGAAPSCRLDGVPTVTCPGDPGLPCPGACNSKGYCEIDCGFGPEVRIPAGTVVIGSDPNEVSAIEPESPEHLATLTRPYFIDRYEVTVPHYRACVEAGACKEPGSGRASTYHSQEGIERKFPVLVGEHAVNYASYRDAEAYCRWKQARLPTEAEWMLAGRGPASTPPGSCETAEDLAANDGRCNERIFPWGDDRDPYRANVPFENDWEMGLASPEWVTIPTPVGFYDGSRHGDYQTKDGSSVYGVHDLIGNMFEWVADWYDPGYYAVAPRQDPQGPATGTERLIKSAGFNILPTDHYDGPFTNTVFLPLSLRVAALPTLRWDQTGFRCARDVP